MRLRLRLLLAFMLLCFVVTNSAANACTGNTVVTSEVTSRSADDSTFDATLGLRRICNRHERDRYGAAQNNRFHFKFTSMVPRVEE